MKRIMIVLAMFALFLAFAVCPPAQADVSSSIDPEAVAPLQDCDAHPNFGTRIDFEDVTTGTIVNVQYLPIGVKFGAAAGGPVTGAIGDGARPGDGNILAGQPYFTGNIHASFWTPSVKGYVTQVGATVGYNDQVGAVTLNAYDCEGNLVASTSNTVTGVEWMAVAANEIHSVILVCDIDPAGSDIDCFTYDAINPCPGAIPTLTEWGMIIMFVIMAAGIIWFVFRQRRSMATA